MRLKSRDKPVQTADSLRVFPSYDFRICFSNINPICLCTVRSPSPTQGESKNTQAVIRGLKN